MDPIDVKATRQVVTDTLRKAGQVRSSREADNALMVAQITALIYIGDCIRGSH